jgi:hypothetical protein
VSNRATPRVIFSELLGSGVASTGEPHQARVAFISVCPDTRHIAVALSSSSSPSSSLSPSFTAPIDSIVFLNGQTFELLAVFRVPHNLFSEGSPLHAQVECVCVCVCARAQVYMCCIHVS